MRKWNDRSLPIPRRKQVFYGIAIAGSFSLGIFHYLAYGYLSIPNMIGIGLAAFLIYGIWGNGLYKIARYLAERRVRGSDNDFNPRRFR